MLEKTIEMNLLYDFYGPLLTEQQRSLLELYYHENLSLGEIAENKMISRQAVNDAVKRAQKVLLRYEDKLKLVDKHLQRKELTITLLKEVQPEAKAVVGPYLKRLLDLD